MLEAKDNAAGHAFLDAHPHLTLVIIGFNDEDRADIAALRSPIIRKDDSTINNTKIVAFPGSEPASCEPDVAENPEVGDDVARLTPRQEEVLSHLRLGLSNKEIARKLDVAESTIKFHCIAIFRHLGVCNRTQAAMRAEERAQQEIEMLNKAPITPNRVEKGKAPPFLDA